MFTENQITLLRILAKQPDHSFTMSELGRLIGKRPGVFQRGLNALDEEGYIRSTRQGNRRYICINKEHPLLGAVCRIIDCEACALPQDVYLTYPTEAPACHLTVAEASAVYATAAMKLLIIAGPNGAGKTTFAREYLPQEGHCPVFINADFIAHGLSPFAPEQAAIQAGRLMLKELGRHITSRRSVAIETTLSGRRYAQLIPRWQAQGYAVKLIFLALPSVEMAIARVASRIKQGGHAIPEETIRRRYSAGRVNFDQVYKPLVDAWALYDNSGPSPILLEEEEA
jgi:predicted ABC-type ATPase